MKKKRLLFKNPIVCFSWLLIVCVVFACVAIAGGCTIKLVGTGDNPETDFVSEETKPTVEQTTTTTAKQISTVEDLQGVWDGGMLIAFDKSWSVMWTPQFVRTYYDNGSGSVSVRDASGSVSEVYGFDVEGDVLTLTDSTGAQCVCRRVSSSLICSDANKAKGTWAYLTKGTDGKQVWNLVSLEQPTSGQLQYLGTASVGGNFTAKTEISSYSLRYIGGVFRLRLDLCAVMTFDESNGVMKPLSSPNNKDIASDFVMYKLSGNTKLNSTQTNELLREFEKKLGLTAQ